MNDPTMTEAEWRRRQCVLEGHSLDVVVRVDGEPTNVVCSRCGDHWPVGSKWGLAGQAVNLDPSSPQAAVKSWREAQT